MRLGNIANLSGQAEKNDREKPVLAKKSLWNIE